MVNKRLLILILFSLFLLPVFAGAANYLDGALLRAEGDIRVYLINVNIKRWVSSIEVFNSNNFKWQDVKIVSKKEVAKIKEGEPLVLETVSPRPSPSASPSAKATEDKTEGAATPTPIASASPLPPVPAKINEILPPLDYIRADWIVSDITANYGRVGQKIIFKYSDKEKDKIENFRLYEKKPGDRYFAKIAEFEEVPSTGCEDIDIDGEWMLTEAGQCGYWTIQRMVPPGAVSSVASGVGRGRGTTAYLFSADYSVGDYTYYVAGVDQGGKETPASLEAKMVFLNPVSVLSPVDGQQISGVYPNFKWTIASGPPNDDAGWPADSMADYFVMISDDKNAQSPVWAKQLKILSGETERQLFYDGLGLNPAKKYKVNIYGRYRKSEYDPDYISIPFNIPEFWIKKPGLVSVFRNIFAEIFSLFF